jgi:hypothetical protein
VSDDSALGLESSLRRLPGVLGCVILTHPDGSAAEVQAFTRVGQDRGAIHQLILKEVERRGQDAVDSVLVFELEAESHLGDRESLDRAVELAEQQATARGPFSSAPPAAQPRARPGRRVPVRRVVLSSSARESRAEVALGSTRAEAVGQAGGEKTPHGLNLLVEATLRAAQKLTPGAAFALRGAIKSDVLGREAVLVVVASEGEPESIGAALVRGGPVAEAAVRATLDAINRRLGYS